MTEEPSLTGRKKEELSSFWLKKGTFRLKLKVTFGQDRKGDQDRPRSLACESRRALEEHSAERAEAEVS